MLLDQHSLKTGTIVDRYTIIRVLGEGGFGITYLAEDIQLGLNVVIKEYFPNEFAMRSGGSTITAKGKSLGDFSKGMQRFKEEAQTLAKFNHPSIVKILGYFEANDTAYFVMEYEEGIDLAQYMKQKGKSFSQEEILSIMIPILEGLKEVHKYNFLHRDIKPGNILLRTNKSPVLIDFGASELAIGEASRSITSMLTEGYAPLEQYSTDIKQQGPFTDIYAIAAVMYKMITGNVPPSAQTRSYQLLQDDNDPYAPLLSLKMSKYDVSFLKAIDRALSMKAKDRPQNVQEFQENIAGKFVQKERLLKTTQRIKKEEKKKSTIFVMLLVALIVVVVGAFGYYEYSDYQKAKKEQIVQKQINDMRKQVEIEQKKIIEANKKRLEEIQKRKKEKAENLRLAALELEKEKQRKKELERKKKIEAERIRLAELEKYKVMEEKRKKEEEVRKIEAQKLFPLTINVDPIDARVKILNIKPKYHDGIQLKKGKYEIRVSRKGYKSKTVIIKLESKTDEYNISLTKKDNKNNANQKTSNKQFISYTKSCEESDFSACYKLGLMYQYGKGLKRNASGQMNTYGKHIIKKNASRALKLYQKACNGGNASGCHGLGTMYTFGIGVKKNVLKAMKLYKKASDGGSCHGDASLGNIYEEGKVVKRNMSKALKLYTQSCKRGCGRGCTSYHNLQVKIQSASNYNVWGKVYERDINYRDNKFKALEMYKESCSGGNTDGCKNYKRLRNK